MKIIEYLLKTYGYFTRILPLSLALPRRDLQHSFVEIDHEIFSMVILSLPLIHEGLLSVSGERMHNTG